MPPEGTTGGASRGSFPALQQQSEGIDLQTIENELLPQKIKDFEQSSANLDQIATYCRSLYASPNIPRAQYEEMLAETRGYVQQSISSLAYQIASSAETLQQYLNEQLLVLGDQVSEIEMISLRLSSVHKLNGIKATRSSDEQRPQGKRKKQIKLDTPLIQVSDLKPPTKLDLYAYDKIGVSLVGDGAVDDADYADVVSETTVDHRLSGYDSIASPINISPDRKSLNTVGTSSSPTVPQLPNSGSGTIRRSSIVRRQSNFGRPPSQVISSQAPAPPSLVAKAKFNVPKSTSVDAGIASSTGTLAPPPPPPPPPSVGGPVVRPASLISPSKSELAEIVTPSLTAEKPTKSAASGFNIGELQTIKLKSTAGRPSRTMDSTTSTTASAIPDSTETPPGISNSPSAKSITAAIKDLSLESTKSVQEVKELAKLAPPVETMQPVPAPVVPVIKPPMNPPVSISAAGTPQNTRPPPAIPPAALPPSRPPAIVPPMRPVNLPPLLSSPTSTGSPLPPPSLQSLSRSGSFVGSPVPVNLPPDLPRSAVRPPPLGVGTLPRPPSLPGSPRPAGTPTVRPSPSSTLSRSGSAIIPALPPPANRPGSAIAPPSPAAIPPSISRNGSTSVPPAAGAIPPAGSRPGSASLPPPPPSAAIRPPMETAMHMSTQSPAKQLPSSPLKPPQPPPPPPAAVKQKLLMQAEYDFTANESDEMTIKEGEIIVVIKDLGDGWVEGRIDERNVQGLFPANYAKPI